MEIKKVKLLLLFIFVSFIACKKEQHQKESLKTYTYEILNKDDKVKGFFQRKVAIKSNERLDTIIRFSKNKESLDSLIENYVLVKNGLKNLKTNSYYLNNEKKDSCYFYKDFYNDRYKICYFGKTNLKIKTKSFKDVYKFKISRLVEDGVSRHLYFDNKYILLKEEYIAGYAPYFNIEIMNK